MIYDCCLQIRVLCVAGLLATTLTSQQARADEPATFPAEAESVPTERVETEPEPSQVSLIPLLTLKADVRDVLKAEEYFRQLTGDDTENVEVFDLFFLSGNRPAMPAQNDSRSCRLEISTTVPGFATAVDIVEPGGRALFRKVTAEYADDDEAIKTQEDGITVVDDIQLLYSDDYLVVRVLENAFTANGAAELRQLLQSTQQERLISTISIATHPRRIFQSAVGPILAAQRATLLTQAQQRDADDALSTIGRSVWQKLIVGLFDAWFRDTELFEFHFKFSEHDQKSRLELQFTARRDSEFDRYIGRLGLTRNRVMSYLYPDQAAFATLSLPLPELVASALPQLSSESLVWLQQSAGRNVAPSPTLARLAAQIAERKQIDGLVQSVPVADGSTLNVLVIPVASASDLEPETIQLISAGDGSDQWEFNVGEIAGWPLHRGRGEETQAFLVLTDHCIAVGTGSDRSLPILEKIVTRDLGEISQTSRFQRAAFSAQTTGAFLVSTGFVEYPAAIRARLNSDDAVLLSDRIEFTLQTSPQKLSLVATFEPDAFHIAMAFYEYFLEILEEVLDSFS